MQAMHIREKGLPQPTELGDIRAGLEKLLRITQEMHDCQCRFTSLCWGSVRCHCWLHCCMHMHLLIVAMRYAHGLLAGWVD